MPCGHHRTVDHLASMRHEGHNTPIFVRIHRNDLNHSSARQKLCKGDCGGFSVRLLLLWRVNTVQTDGHRAIGIAGGGYGQRIAVLNGHDRAGPSMGESRGEEQDKNEGEGEKGFWHAYCLTSGPGVGQGVGVFL